jgi:hypothetical protein
VSQYQRIGFVVLSVYAYIALLAGLKEFVVLTLSILYSQFVSHLVIATEIRIIEGLCEIAFGLLILAIRAPVALFIGERLDSLERTDG